MDRHDPLFATAAIGAMPAIARKSRGGLGGTTNIAIPRAQDAASQIYPEHNQTMEALARLEVRSGKTDADTPRLLSEVAYRGETKRWREWARLEMTKAEK